MMMVFYLEIKNLDRNRTPGSRTSRIARIAFSVNLPQSTAQIDVFGGDRTSAAIAHLALRSELNRCETVMRWKVRCQLNSDFGA